MIRQVDSRINPDSYIMYKNIFEVVDIKNTLIYLFVQTYLLNRLDYYLSLLFILIQYKSLISFSKKYIVLIIYLIIIVLLLHK